MLAAAAVATALVLPTAVANPGHLTGAEQLVNFAYPVADCILLTIAVVGAAVAGWRAGAVWSLLAAGIFVLVGGDVLWALQAAAGPGSRSWAPTPIYPLWAWAAAVAAWLARAGRAHGGSARRAHPRRRTGRRRRRGRLLIANEWVEVPASSVLLAGSCCSAPIQCSGFTLAASVRDSMGTARERELVDEVRQALADRELELHYQPLIDARTGAVVGAEALLRWSRDGVNVPPDRFLPAVER